MSTAVERIRAQLFERADEKYRDFNRKLIPTVPAQAVIGVRTPDLRALARLLGSTPDAQEFMADLPHRYFEENNLHAFLLEGIRDFEACVERLNLFLPYIDNWATCDQLSPRVLARHPEKLRRQIDLWLESQQIYVRRFAIGMLMRYFLGDNYRIEDLERVAQMRPKEYYLRMMVAWYFATALAKQYPSAIRVLEAQMLEPWTHNRAIQKALESRRISPEQKIYLKSLKISSRMGS